MTNNEQNITNMCDEDKKFIRAITDLSPENKLLFKGILIGLDLQEEMQPVTTVR
jgi:hypothetical protein